MTVDVLQVAVGAVTVEDVLTGAVVPGGTLQDVLTGRQIRVDMEPATLKTPVQVGQKVVLIPRVRGG